MHFLERLFGGSGCERTIVSFEIVKLRTSGMRGTTEYEILMKDGDVQISRYTVMYNEKRHELEKRAVCSLAEVLQLFNDCRLLSWDGFDGHHPRGVRDGTMFTLKATVNEGKQIKACGSQNFPKYYRAFMNGLHELLYERA